MFVTRLVLIHVFKKLVPMLLPVPVTMLVHIYVTKLVPMLVHICVRTHLPMIVLMSVANIGANICAGIGVKPFDNI
jgi:hypothetical protein